ncbi:hypothetical protein GCM10007216_30560 [Thalassobacillus devorans]|uniref:Resolvase/invertase-type recombinase catalytic domain-containing protein n=1 Tax=Thalassobacillus devorans TaxID=279813 RepID=A0ABQ1PI59_9BACI|nr:hypothetical protein [Thalassobacillus devorans]NIK30016.1 hypothetical protein [Thalassobacillus devorans]GGC97666.1 hypothetical protein GCM10007216_30560 [Thalassobacillus devorans]
MANVAIYYRLTKSEDTGQVIQFINEEIHKFDDQHLIKGVFVDDHKDRTQLNELVNQPLHEIDKLFINEEIDDEFDWKLLNELAKTEGFTIHLLSE